MHVNSAASAVASARLQRLAGFLAQDPDNPMLLAEACDTALACGRHDQADAYVARAEQVTPGAADWQHRRAQLCIARRDWPQARMLLEALCARCGDEPALLHDLARVHLLAGDAEAAHGVLQPWAQGEGLAREPVRDLLQPLWLRACHHLGRLEEAWGWTQRARAADALTPAAAGVASLVALDRGETAAAGSLADLALAADAGHPEASVTRGCLALAAGDAGEAVVWLERAAQRLPAADVRVCSALGLARLLAGDAVAACAPLEDALRTMPEHAQGWQALGWARWLAGNASGAVAAFEAAVRADDEAADSHAALALVLLMAGKREGAAASLRRAEQLDPKDGTAVLVRALAAGQPARTEVQSLVRGLLGQWRPRP